MRCVLSLLLMMLCAETALANAGFFAGAGHTIQLGKSADIELVSEEVTIRPLRSVAKRMAGADDQRDRVLYHCRFELRNRTPKSVTIQVGFPLNSDYLSKGPDLAPHEWLEQKERDSSVLLKRYHFVARDSAQTYHPRFVAADKDKRLHSIFLWDMTFGPDETRVLNVDYQIIISASLAYLGKSHGAAWIADGSIGKFDEGKIGSSRNEIRRLDALNIGLREWFEYVTETGSSWAGKIKHATFRIELNEFESYLKDRGWSETRGPIPYKHVLIHRTITPDGWKQDEKSVRWDFDDYQPGKLIRICYWFSIFPQNAEELRALHTAGKRSKPDKSLLAAC